MNRLAKTVSWVFIFSILSMGCYFSVMIGSKGDEKQRVFSEKIKSVVTKNRTEYKFDSQPTIVNDTIVGEAGVIWGQSLIIQQASIPLSDVTKVYVSEFIPLTTTFVIVGIIGLVVLMVSSPHYVFYHLL